MTPTRAQTHLQLFEEMRAGGYGEADCVVIHLAYAYARELFTGSYRGSGKPFVTHLVGTASALVALRLPVAVVAAGLLHAAYQLGDFGAGWLGSSDLKRTQVRQRMGDAIEALIDRYTRMPWAVETPSELLQRLERNQDMDRDVVLMRLANELEDHLDLGILYHRNAADRLERARRMRPTLIELAKRLNEPLSDALVVAFDQCLATSVPERLRTDYDASFVVPTTSRTAWRWRRLLQIARRKHGPC